MSQICNWKDTLSRPAHGDHIVQFYCEEDRLVQAVGYYCANAITRGEAVVIVAPPAHRIAFEKFLTQKGFLIHELERQSMYIALDAQEMLSKFLVNGEPDWELFKISIEGALNRARMGGTRKVRAYGEMVNLLWHAGKPAEALLLETFWNRLSEIQPFSLFCAYQLKPESAQSDSFVQRVCQAHSHFFASEDGSSKMFQTSGFQADLGFALTLGSVAFVAEDDEDDYHLLQELFAEYHPYVRLKWFQNGEELTDALFDPAEERPSLVLLDLNMPRKDGRQALKEIRTRSLFDDLPIVVLTTSNAEHEKKYVTGFPKAWFVTKPMGYQKYVNFIKSIPVTQPQPSV